MTGKNWHPRQQALFASEQGKADIARLCQQAESLAAQQALFHDEDYFWLLRMNQPEVARILKKRRRRLAKQYLRESWTVFRQLIALHSYLTAADSGPTHRHDPVATLAFVYPLKWSWAYLSLYVGQVKYQLAPLAGIHCGFEDMLVSLQRRLELAPSVG